MVGKDVVAVLDEQENEVQHEEQPIPKLKKLTLNTSVVRRLNLPYIGYEKSFPLCERHDHDDDDDKGRPERREQPERPEQPERREQPERKDKPQR